MKKTKTRKTILVIFAVLMLALNLVNAITQQEINEAKGLTDSKVDCKSLSDSQLEIIGEYEMELMHPGDSHEAMHKMMGLKEGSEPEKQFHMNMAKTIYCGESGGMMGGGMMNMMGNNMMGSGGMMNMMGGQNIQSGMTQSMMGNNPMGFGYGYWTFINILYTILLIGLIILVYLWIVKLWKGVEGKGKKK